MKIRLLLALVGLAIGFALPTFAQQKEPTPSESTPEATPRPRSGTTLPRFYPTGASRSGFLRRRPMQWKSLLASRAISTNLKGPRSPR